MRSNFKFVLILTFFALFTFVSCQDEVIEETPQNQEETIVPNSQLANLMRSTSSNDGSVDDIMDEANCFSISLPVTIIANGITITIDTLEDLDLIEDIFDEFSDDDDVLDFLFPITIILNDYTEVTIENQDQLESFIDDCTEIDDDVIECVDFVYPITFSLYDSTFQIIDTVVIDNDEELHDFLEDLGDDNPNGGIVLASLNFPVELVYADGTTIEVNSNQELEAAIEAAEIDCDDDEDYCNEEFVVENLIECHWRISSFNDDDNYVPYLIGFNENGSFAMTGENNVVVEGHWNMSISNNGSLELVLSELTGFSEDLEGSWIFVECDDDEFKLMRETDSGTYYIELDQECEGDVSCSAQEVIHELNECVWYSGTNLLGNDLNGPYNFNEDGTVTVSNPNGNAISGTYELVLTDNGLYVVLDLPEPYSAISLEWLVIECEDHRLEMTNGDNLLVLEQDCTGEYDCLEFEANVGDQCETATGMMGVLNESCECEVEDNNAFECFESYTVVVCDDDPLDGFFTFNLEELYSNCPQDNVEITYHLTLSDAEAGVEALTSPYTNVTNPQTIYARVNLAGTTTYEVFEIGLIVENCNSSECTEGDIDTILLQCHWNADINNTNDFNDFNFHFNPENELEIYGTGVQLNGVWMTFGNPNDGVYVEISQLEGNFQMFNGEWLVVECSEEYLILNGPNDYQLVLDRDCYDDSELYTSAAECNWEVHNFSVNGDDITENYNDVLFTFFENDFAIAEVGMDTVNYGNLEVEADANGDLVVLFFMYGVTSDLGDYYTVAYISDEEIVLTSQGTKTLVLRRTCAFSNQTGDTLLIKDWLDQGEWEITYATMESQDHSTDYDNVIFNFQDGADLIGVNNNNGVTSNLQYEVLSDQEGNLRMVINYLGIFPYWQMDDDWYITEVNNTRIELHHVNDDNNNEFVLVFEKL